MTTLYRISVSRGISSRAALAGAAALTALLTCAPLHASPFYWNTANGTWLTGANWSDNATSGGTTGTAPGSTDTAFFNQTSINGNQTVGLTANATISGLTFSNSGTSILNGSGGNRFLTIGSDGITVAAGAGAVTIGDATANRNLFVVLGANQTWTSNSTNGVTIRNNARGLATGTAPVTLTVNAASSGSISDSGVLDDGAAGAVVSLVVASTGTGNFSVAGGSFSGGTTIKSGALASAGGFGTGAILLGDTSGSANATLIVNNSAATFANNITVQAGSSGNTLKIQNSGASAPTLSGNITLNNDLAVTTSSTSSGTMTMSGLISGAGKITLTGTAALVLSNANTYGGGTVLTSGILRVNNGGTGSGNSSIGTGALTIGGGTLDNTSGSAVTLATNNDQVWNASFSFTGTNDLNLGNGSVSLGAVGSTRTVTTVAGVLTIGGVISNGAAGTSITKAGNGTLALTSSSSTYTGNTQVSAGVLEVTKLSNAGVASSIGAGSNSTIGSTVLNGNGTLRYIGSGDSTNRVLTIGGGGGGTLDASGSGALNFTSSNTSAFGSSNVAYVFNLSGNSTANNTYAANQANNGNGTFSMVKNGTGKWILSGNSTYTGSTTVNSGTLLINGSTAAGSAVTVNGGKLGGTGTIGGTVTVNSGATLSPGASIESLATGSNTWNGGGALDMEFSTDGSSGTAGSQWDLLAITGGLDLSGAGAGSFTINLFTMANASTPGLLAVWNPNVSHTWAGFVTTTTGFTGFASDKFVFNLSGFQNSINGTFSVVQNVNNLDLVYSSIPEPSVWMLLAFSLTALVVLRRRRA